MDIEFARTFLAVVTTGNFIGAAQRLHITQSTVSTRIQTLEVQIGARLFLRGRGGAQLTPAGQRFLRHANTLVRALEQARHEVGLPPGFKGCLTLRGRIALWDGFLPEWVTRMRTLHPDISLHLEVGFEEDTLQGVVEGTVDIGLLYTPEIRPGLGIVPLFEEKLVLVATGPTRTWPDSGYVHMDWGAEFHKQFCAAFPDLPAPAITANIGWLLMQQILHCGGSGYFPLRITRDLVAAGKLSIFEDAPCFSLPAYGVYSMARREDILDYALAVLRQQASAVH